ncbi:prephenate dehydratase domain-containing protein [Mannheimia haemolytica]
MLPNIEVIHTLGPVNTNCESAARAWFKNNHIKNGKIILHSTLEDAVLSVSSSNHAVLGCIVYPDLHNLVFSNLNKLELVDVFIHDTYEMVFASRFINLSEIKTVASHPAPSGLIRNNYSDVNICYVNSNSQAAIDCMIGKADGCITTIPSAKEHKLHIINNFGVIPMGFTIHVFKE